MSYHVRRPDSLKASLRTRSVGSPPAAARRRPSLPRSGNTSTCPHGARPWRVPPAASQPCATSTGQGAYAGARVAWAQRTTVKPTPDHVVVFNPFTHPPALRFSPARQPHDARLVPSLPPGKPRKPTPARLAGEEITFLHARGGRGPRVFTGPTAAGAARPAAPLPREHGRLHCYSGRRRAGSPPAAVGWPS